MDQFGLTPSSSDVDLLIEKFRVEISRSIDETDTGTRKLTLTSSTVKANTSGANNDIDKQITDLENLIKKLQDEISDMYKNVDKEVKYTPLAPEDSCTVRRDLSNETIIIDNECYNNEETENVRERTKGKHSKEYFESEPYSHVFPLMVRDLILPFDGGLKTSGHTDVLATGKNDKALENLSIKQEIMDVWDDLPDYTPKGTLEVLIDELQAEISGNMELLKEVKNKESNQRFEEDK